MTQYDFDNGELIRLALKSIWSLEFFCAIQVAIRCLLFIEELLWRGVIIANLNLNRLSLPSLN